jgi:hypothetical protein
MQAQLSRALAHLHQKADAVVAQVADAVRPTLLPKAQAFRMLRQLLNYEPDKARSASLKYDTHLDFYLSDSGIDCHRDRLEVDGHAVKVLTMKEPPARTFAHMLQDLYAVPSSLIACLEWQRVPNAKMRRDVRTRQRHFFNKRVSFVNYLSPQTRPDEMLVDDSASATVSELGQSLTEMEVRGHFFGSCSLSIVVYDRDHRRVDRAFSAPSASPALSRNQPAARSLSSMPESASISFVDSIAESRALAPSAQAPVIGRSRSISSLNPSS